MSILSDQVARSFLFGLPVLSTWCWTDKKSLNFAGSSSWSYPVTPMHASSNGRIEGFLEFPFWKQSFIYGACGQDGPLRLTIKPLLGACFSNCCNLCPYRWKPEQNAANKWSPFQLGAPNFPLRLLANGSIFIEGHFPRKNGVISSQRQFPTPKNHSLAKGCF